MHLGKADVDMKDIYELQVSLKEHIKDFLAFPSRADLHFARHEYCSRQQQVNWQSNIDYTEIPIRQRIEDYARTTWNVCRFESTLFAMTMSFWLGTYGQGFEAILEQKLKYQLQQQFGITIDESIFDA
ncbi:hypothetical protein K492DRAFT_205724 [Lichtheimia hyalospora FSU 10163]|nr:hypothetical protein K492DRAFT_205724 [Lichtheimia hyalospora FSU 10163]